MAQWFLAGKYLSIALIGDSCGVLVSIQKEPTELGCREDVLSRIPMWCVRVEFEIPHHRF